MAESVPSGRGFATNVDSTLSSASGLAFVGSHALLRGLLLDW